MQENHEVIIERIENQRNSLHAMELRRKMLQDLLGAPHKDHRTSKYKIDTESTRRLIGKIKGLEIREIPNYCCLTEIGIKKIFEKADTGVIVTPRAAAFQPCERNLIR